jgi:hypothetical protein
MSTLIASLPATTLESSQRDVNNAAQLGRVALQETQRGEKNPGGLRTTLPLNRSALPRLKAPLRLIDDVDAALAPDDAIVAVAATQRFQ